VCAIHIIRGTLDTQASKTAVSAVRNTAPSVQNRAIRHVRRRAAVKREVLPDAKFGDSVLNQFMNA